MNIVDIGYMQRIDEESKLNRLIDVPWNEWAPFFSHEIAVITHAAR